MIAAAAERELVPAGAGFAAVELGTEFAADLAPNLTADLAPGLAAGLAAGLASGFAAGLAADLAPTSRLDASQALPRLAPTITDVPDSQRLVTVPAIIDLAAISADDRGRVGNKAWRLAQLGRAGLPVPAGFCIAADAFDDAADAADAQPATLPAALGAAILAAYRRLGAPLVAVRSSAADEDRLDQSAAGVYATVLNVTGEAELLAAVQSCRAARPAPGDDGTAPAPLALLVQRQVEAEAAGVLFTADPLDGATDRLVVNVVHGLGEPLASGRVNGDTFHLAPSGDVLRQQLRHKPTMLTRHGERPVPPGRRRRPTLTAPELKRLAELAAQVSRHFDHGASEPATTGGAHAAHGLDIEFAFQHGRPILLQARPIPPRLVATRGTACEDAALQDYARREQQKLSADAAQLVASGRCRGAEVVWSAGNIRELLPTPSRFSFALFQHIFAGRAGAIAAGRRRLGYRLEADTGDDLFALIAGQPYFNLERDAATYDVGVPLPIDTLLAEVAARPERANYPELGLYPELLANTPGGADAAAAFRSRMLAAAATQRRRFGALLRRLKDQAATARAEPMADPTINLTPGSATDPAAPAADTATLQAAIARELSTLRQLGLRFVIAARFGFFFADLARRRLRSLAGNPAAGQRRYARLLQGLPGSLITEQSHDLERVAEGRLARADYLARHGHLAVNELELSLPRLAEQPAQLDALLAELKAGGRSPRAEFARQAARRRRTENALRRHLAARPDDCAALFAELEAAQHYLPLRESLKYHLAIHYAALRRHLLALAAELGWPADGLLQLEPAEVQAISADPAGREAALTLSQQRREERRLARRLAQLHPLPTVIFSSRPEAIGAASAANAEHAELANAAGSAARLGASRGRDEYAAEPIAPGCAEGIVRLIRFDDESSDRPRLRACAGHEIVVAPSANLGLAPLFRSAAGVIVEVGGVLAHCACQAREAGIPALVLADATRLLRDGDHVRIDARRGCLTVLARADGPRPVWQ